MFFVFVFQVRLLSPVVDAIVLQITVWFWIHFEQIFHTSPAVCHRPIGSCSHICFCPLQSRLLFIPLALTQSKPVGRLQSYVPTLPFPQFHIYSCSHNSLPRGPQISVGGEHHCWPILTGTTPPSHSWRSSNRICASISSNTHTPSTCRSHSCRPIIFAGFDIKAYSPKLLSNNERGKTDIVVKRWPSFLHFRWSASTLKFPILHIKKEYLQRTPAAFADPLQAAGGRKASREGIWAGWCSFKGLGQLHEKQSLANQTTAKIPTNNSAQFLRSFPGWRWRLTSV